MTKTFFSSIKDISDAGKNNIAKDFIPACKLIFSSPASLSYNSPGALGFGVKRAGLVIPESVMLLVAPACCGRNSTILSAEEGYSTKMFYLQMSESDLVSGLHLKKISDCIDNIILKANPKVITICITCVDALLGTDLESICAKLTESKGVCVVPTYMYALTREGRKPPMTAIRAALYSLLKKEKTESTTVNIMGFFSPLDSECELFSLLKSAGIKKINQISECKTFEEYQKMGNANFNLVLNPESRYAANEVMNNIKTPYIELVRLYDTEKILKQYKLFASSIGVSFDESILKSNYDEAEKSIEDFKNKYPDAAFAVGQMLNADPFELSLFLCSRGFKVPYIYACPTEESFTYIDRLAKISPDTKVYTNISPTMADFNPAELNEKIDIAIGKDIEFYFSDSAFVAWNDEKQPFGFRGVKNLFNSFKAALDGKETVSKSDGAPHTDTNSNPDSARNPVAVSNSDNAPSKNYPDLKKVEGLFSVLSPFSPDQSGASSVLYEYEGLNVICDAGGCAGNVSGFDEPRFGKIKSYMYSAGLRDMDAIMGRDDVLFEKIKDASLCSDSKFAALIGTPVPNVIGTDFKAYKRIAEKSLDIPFIYVKTTGMQHYDTGEEKAYCALLEEFCFKNSAAAGTQENTARIKNTVGIWGLTPLELLSIDTLDSIKKAVQKKYNAEKTIIFGFKDCDVFTDFKNAATLTQNIVLSPSGLKPAELLKEKYGIPYEIDFDILFDEEVASINAEDFKDKNKILILHQQVMAESLKQKLLKQIPEMKIDTATFFMCSEEISKSTIAIKEEYELFELIKNNEYDAVIADPIFKRLLSQADFKGKFFALAHYAVSGQLYEPKLCGKKFILNAEDL